MSDAQLVVISASAILLVYRADFTRPADDQSRRPQAMYVSSLWCCQDGQWVNVFSQDTPAHESIRVATVPNSGL